jgi:hypothetical protein
VCGCGVPTVVGSDSLFLVWYGIGLLDPGVFESAGSLLVVRVGGSY